MKSCDLRAERARYKISQTVLAKAMGLNVQHILALEKFDIEISDVDSAKIMTAIENIKNAKNCMA